MISWKHNILLFIIVLLGFSSQAQISPEKKNNSSGLSKLYFKSYLTDTRDIILSPAKWDKKDWIIFGSVAGGTLALFSVDKNINTWFQLNRTDLSDKITYNFLDPFGTGELYKNYTLISLASIYLYGTITKNYKPKFVALEAAKAFAISGFLVGITKASFGRHRPYQDNPSNSFIWEGPNIDNYFSFVSGHTMSTFAVATVLAEEYKDKIAIPIISYSIAGLVGISRLHDNKHWASDVFAGAAFGWAIGKLISVNNNNRFLIARSNNNGISISYKF